MKEKFFYGGQAVIEGVMMRGPHNFAIAVRLPHTGEIAIERARLLSTIYVNPFWKLPFARGLALMAETIHLGMKSLIWSANMNAGGQDIEIGKREIVISLVVAAVGGLLLFIGLPLLGAGFLVNHAVEPGIRSSVWFVAVEGVIRIVLVLGYLVLIAWLFKDVRRVFEYHGAEHKTINAYEAGWSLEVEQVRRASLLHPRCGTGFLVVVVIVSIILFFLVALLQPSWPGLVVSRLAGIPIIAGTSYEWIRLLARYREHPVARIMLIPILATQKLTTREPDASQLEVAIAAFKAVREDEPGELEEGAEVNIS